METTERWMGLQADHNKVSVFFLFLGPFAPSASFNYMYLLQAHTAQRGIKIQRMSKPSVNLETHKIKKTI